MLSFLWFGLALSGASASLNKPNIVLFISDNLAWNDGDSHGSKQTPNINALAHSGLTLENHYATPICAPSRAALMTGKYPVQTDAGHASETSGTPVEGKLLPQHLKDLGYATHLIGKWRLGSFIEEPSNVKFESNTDSWIEETDVFDYTKADRESSDYDFRKEYQRADGKFEQSATDVYVAEAVKRIKKHDQSNPMLLMVANSGMQVNNSDQIVYSQKNTYDAMLSELDRSVGEVFSALHESEMLSNTIVLFSTDNAVSGYPTGDVNNVLWEGGVRGRAVLWSPLILQNPHITKQKIHVADWLPTLITAAGGDISALGSVDGTDQWEALSSASYRIDQYELHENTNYNENLVTRSSGLSGRDVDSRVGRILKHLNLSTPYNEIKEIANMKHNDTSKRVECEAVISPCLLNTEERIVLNAGFWLSGGQKFF